MFKHLLVILCLFACLQTKAQQKLSQPDLKASYEVPKDWTVHEYFKGDWDSPGGSSICHCAMAVNIMKIPNGDDFDYLHMVVYPSDKKGVANPMRSQVWQYKIVNTNGGDSLHTPNLQWVHYNAKLVVAGENRFKDFLAWKYQTHNEKDYYTVYFWAKPAIMEQYKAVIEKIMKGFKAI